MRLGVFGGTFDPIHYGHLLLAECCREQCVLDQVWFVPAAVPPHKQQRQLSAPRHRVDMLRLAVAGHDSFEVATLEIDRGGISYTLDTLATIHAQQPETELLLLMGADSLRDFPTWRDPLAMCRLALPVIVRRGSSAQPDVSVLAPFLPAERLDAVRQRIVDMPLVDLSSSDLRARVAAGRSIRYRTPRAVEQYVLEHGLYRAAPP